MPYSSLAWRGGDRRWQLSLTLLHLLTELGLFKFTTPAKLQCPFYWFRPDWACYDSDQNDPTKTPISPHSGDPQGTSRAFRPYKVTCFSSSGPALCFPASCRHAPTDEDGAIPSPPQWTEIRRFPLSRFRQVSCHRDEKINVMSAFQPLEPNKAGSGQGVRIRGVRFPAAAAAPMGPGLDLSVTFGLPAEQGPMWLFSPHFFKVSRQQWKDFSLGSTDSPYSLPETTCPLEKWLPQLAMNSKHTAV